MPLEVESGDDFAHQHERLMWDHLVRNLQVAYQEDGRRHFLLGNFQCEQQFDALYLSPKAACVLEFKSHSGQLDTPQNHPWYADGFEMKAAGCRNPLKQVQRCKNSFIDRVLSRWRSILHEVPGPNWHYTNGRVVFNAPIEWENTFDRTIRNWFDVADLEQIARQLLAIQIKTFDLTDDQVLLVRNAVMGTPRPAHRSRLLYFKGSSSEFNQSLRDVRSRQGEAQQAADAFEQIARKARLGQDPFAALPFDEVASIDGLRSYRLTTGYRLLVVHHHGTNYLVMIGNENAAAGWIEANSGLLYTVDLATGKISPARPAVEVIDAPTAITATNEPFLNRVEDTIRRAEIPKDEIAPVQELDEDSSEEERGAAIEAIENSSLRALMRSVTELLRIGEEEEAEACIKLYAGQAVPVADAPELQEAAVSDGSNSERLVDIGDLEPSDQERFLRSFENDSWMYFLHPGQKRVVDEDHDKPAILTGVSGSGKTSVLMHRARRLAAEHPKEKVLVLTLNKNLAKLISIGMDSFCDEDTRARIEVESLHDYLARFLASTDVRKFLESFAEYTGQQEAMAKLLAGRSPEELPRLFQPLEESALRALFHEFLGQLEGEDRESLRNLEVFLDAQSPGIDAENYIYEELELIRSAFPCFDEYGGYLTDFERQGRGIGLQKTRKEQILRILKLWERHQIDFQFLDHMGLTQAAFLAFEESGGIPGLFRRRFVLVDEFQDLSDLELRILMRVPHSGPNHLFLTGDFAQKLYAKQLDLGAVGLGRDRRILRCIRKNYRNSRQILAAADRLLTCWPGATARDTDMEVLRPELATRETSKPAAYRAVDPVLAAWHDVAEAIREYRLPSQAVCVISANTALYPVDEILEASPEGIAVSALADWSSDDELRSVPVADITSVKGFEFKVVFIIGLESGSFPASGRHDEEVWRDAQRLYVAITRGMNEVRMYHRGEPSVMLQAMDDAIDFFEAPALPAAVVTAGREKDESASVVDARPEIPGAAVADQEDIAMVGECWTQTVVNGVRFLVFERRPNQLELASATNSTSTDINHLLFQQHNLALVPTNRLQQHLVADLCRSLGFVAEFRSAPVAVVAPPPKQKPPVVEVLPPEEKKEPERENVVTVPLEGIPVGPLTLGTLEREFGDFRPPFGQTDFVDATIREYALVGPDDLRLLVHDVRLEGHERYVTCGQNETPDKVWNRLVDRLRLGIKTLENGDLVMELRQARFTTGKWSNRFRATRGQLETGAGFDVPDLLRELGALRTGSKEDVYGETNRNRLQYCVTFAEGNTAVPLAAYAAVTVLPLLNGYRQEDASEEG
jgi:superfamily I DNA/RNA helicase